MYRARLMQAFTPVTLACALTAALPATSHATAVLVWGSGISQSGVQEVATYLQTLGSFTSVTAQAADTLSFATVNTYDRVLYFSDGSSDVSNAARGNVLADFADTGKRLVLATFSWANQGGNTLQGRIVTDGLSPYLYQGTSLYSNASMASNDGSDFFDGVTTLTGYYRDNVGLTAGSTSRASWTDGESLLAVRGNVVGVNLYPRLGGGDYQRLFVNALSAEITTNATVPEPSSLLLVAMAGLGLVASSRRARATPA